MKLPPLWMQRKHKLFPCSTLSPVVTQSRRLLGKAKRQHSTRGGHSMLQRRSSLDLSQDRQVWAMSACLYSSHMWCLCMIGGVTKLLWTQPGSTCSRQKPDLSTPFHQPELHCCSMQDEQHTRVAMYGVRPRSENQIFLLQSPGDGARIRREDGNRCGRYSQKRPCPARSC